jgi:hypothetical protein
MRRLSLTAALVLGALAAFASDASAQRMRMPVSYQQRPLTLPRGTLRPEIGSVLSVERNRPDDDDAWLHFTAGLGVGITNDFELGILVLPLRVAPASRYGSTDPGQPPLVTPWFGHERPDVYGRYRFVRGDVELGLDLHFILPVPEEFHLVMGIPFLFHIADFMRIDTGLYLQSEAFDRAWGHLPLVLTFNPSRRFFFGFDGGMTIGNDARRRPGDDVRLPFGFFLGFTLGRPTVDIKVGTRTIDLQHGVDVWQAWFLMDFYVFL